MGDNAISQLERSDGDARYRTLIEWSPLPMVVHCDGEIIYANPAALSLIGATSEQQVLGTKVFAWVHPDFHSAAVSYTHLTLPTNREV